jgi:hypothetical protein
MRSIVVAVLPLLGCGGTERDIEMESKHLTTKSHYPDTNCMSCHQVDDRITENGETPGFFNLAGTVRQTDGTPHPNVTVILYDALFNTETRTPGKELLRLETDALGMFYSTRALPHVHFEGGEGHSHGERYFPAVLDNQTGFIKHMYFGIDTGSCNMCHHDNYRDMSPLDDVEGDPWLQKP